MFKKNGNGKTSFDRVGFYNALVILVPIIATMIVLHMTTVNDLRQADGNMLRLISVNTQRLETLEAQTTEFRQQITVLMQNVAALQAIAAERRVRP